MATEKLDLLILKTLVWRRCTATVSASASSRCRAACFASLWAPCIRLQRLERSGLVKGSWSVSENNRRARYYTLTAAGRRRLSAGNRRRGSARWPP